MKTKRFYNSWIGVPIWIITGLSIFILFSAVYDYIVLDRSIIRTGLIIASSVILGLSIIIHAVSLKFVSRQIKRQLGG